MLTSKIALLYAEKRTAKTDAHLASNRRCNFKRFVANHQ